MNDDNKYQVVMVTLSNGKSGKFMGKVLVDKEDEGVVQVHRVDFFEPQELPEGTHFEEIRGKGK